MTARFINRAFASSAAVKPYLSTILSVSSSHAHEKGPPRGLALKDNLVYVIRRWSATVDVFSISNLPARTQIISVTGLHHPDDLVVSMSHNSLYVLGWVASNKQLIFDVSLDDGLVHRTWPVIKQPFRLSVDVMFQDLLATCRDGLRSFSASGKLNWFVGFDGNVTTPWHTIALNGTQQESDNNSPERQFIVCHGLSDHEPHQVSVINQEGHVLRSFGARNPGSKPSLLKRPLHLAMDIPASLLYVLDSGNRAVKVLSLPELELVDVILEKELTEIDPRRIVVESDSRRIVIAAEDGRVLIFQY